MREWLQAAVDAAASRPEREFEISVRLVDEAEGRQLNSAYRDRDYATNVLSFPADIPLESLDAEEPMPLGDLVICAEVVRKEATEQGKSIQAHWAHLLVHGTLHLLGYDHESDEDAQAMESLETAILIEKGLPDPYAEDATG